jgi:hypothetical protein
MKSIFLIVFCFIAVAFSSDGPIRVGNGTGEAEFNFFVAHKNLPIVLAACDANSECKGLLADSQHKLTAISQANLKFVKGTVGDPSWIRFFESENEAVVSLAEDVSSVADAFRLLISVAVRMHSPLMNELALRAKAANDFAEINYNGTILRISNSANGTFSIALFEKLPLAEPRFLNSTFVSYGSRLPCTLETQPLLGNSSVLFETREEAARVLHFKSSVQFRCRGEDMMASLLYSLRIHGKAQSPELDVPAEQIFIQAVKPRPRSSDAYINFAATR